MSTKHLPIEVGQDAHLNFFRRIPVKRINAQKPLKLSGQQRILDQVLREQDVRLANMYLGALKALDDLSNPECFVMAAHSLRELMEKIPAYIDLGVENPYPHEKLIGKVRQLEDAWDKIPKDPKQADQFKQSGSIRNETRFIETCGDFFIWLKEYFPRRRSQVAGVLQALDPKRSPLPQPLEDLRVNEWDKIREFFLSIAHHNIQTDPAKFNLWLIALERFLLDRFRPRTFEDHEVIDSIIKEGEQNA